MDTRAKSRTDDPDSDRVRDYLDLVGSRDVRGARALVLSALATDDGGLVRVIDDLLVPAMAEVGARGYDGLSSEFMGARRMIDAALAA